MEVEFEDDENPTRKEILDRAEDPNRVRVIRHTVKPSKPLLAPAPPCATCGGTKTIIDPKSVRRTLAYGDPMESIVCPDCSASSQEGK